MIDGIFIGYDADGVPRSVASFGSMIGVSRITARSDAEGGGLSAREFAIGDPSLKTEVERWRNETMKQMEAD